MREHAVVAGCARRLEGNDILVSAVEDLIRERVALGPFLQRRTWRGAREDDRPSAFPEHTVVGLSSGHSGFLPTFCKQRLSRLSEAETQSTKEATSLRISRSRQELVRRIEFRRLDASHVEMTGCRAPDRVSRAGAFSSLAGPCMA